MAGAGMDQLPARQPSPPAPRQPPAWGDGKLGAGEGKEEALASAAGKFRSNGRKSALGRAGGLGKHWSCRRSSKTNRELPDGAAPGGQQDGRAPGSWDGQAVKAAGLRASLRSLQGGRMVPQPIAVP